MTETRDVRTRHVAGAAIGRLVTLAVALAIIAGLAVLLKNGGVADDYPAALAIVKTWLGLALTAMTGTNVMLSMLRGSPSVAAAVEGVVGLGAGVVMIVVPVGV